MNTASAFGAVITLPKQQNVAIPYIVFLHNSYSTDEKESYRLALESQTHQHIWTNEERSFFLLSLLPQQKQKIVSSPYVRFIGPVNIDIEQLRKLMEGDFSGV